MLLVDRREGSHDLVAPLAKRGIDVAETELAFGDLAFTGKGEKGASVEIGLEFKKLPELIGSMRTSRLEGFQLLGMRAAEPDSAPLYDFAYLLIEGELLLDESGALLERKWHRGRSELRPMKGAMSSSEFLKRLEVLHLRGGLNVRWAKDRTQSLTLIETLYRVWTDKPLDAHTSHIAIYNPPPLLPVSQFRRTVATLPGLALSRSRAAQERFGSLHRAVNAPVREWADLDIEDRHGHTKKLGTSAAEKVVAAIHEDFS